MLDVPSHDGAAGLDGPALPLATTYGVGDNLVWAVQVVLIVFPEGRPESPWSEDQHSRAVEGLVALLDEFFQHLQDPADAAPGTG